MHLIELVAMVVVGIIFLPMSRLLARRQQRALKREISQAERASEYAVDHPLVPNEQ